MLCRAYARSIDIKVMLHYERPEGFNDEGEGETEPRSLELTDAAVALEVGAPTAAPSEPAPLEPPGRAEPRQRVRFMPYVLSLQRQLIAAARYAWLECFVLPSYLRSACWGYAAGVIMAMFIARTFRIAQPALLYIVPCTLLPVILRAVALGRLHRALMWTGEDSSKDGAALRAALTDSSSNATITENLPQLEGGAAKAPSFGGGT
jgi:hypothetical protein